MITGVKKSPLLWHCTRRHCNNYRQKSEKSFARRPRFVIPDVNACSDSFFHLIWILVAEKIIPRKHSVNCARIFKSNALWQNPWNECKPRFIGPGRPRTEFLDLMITQYIFLLNGENDGIIFTMAFGSIIINSTANIPKRLSYTDELESRAI